MEIHPYGQAFADRDVDRIVALLADDAVFHSPVITDPGFAGRGSIAAVHAMIFDSFSDIEFTHEVRDQDEHVLLGGATVLGRPIKMVLLLGFHPDGRIREIWMLARPLTGVVAIAEAIAPGVARHRGVPGLPGAVRGGLKLYAAQAAVVDWIGSRFIGGLNRTTRS
jgi:ketosteroid isomerase-like protein